MLTRRFIVSLLIGILGTSILYTATTQYLIVGDSWLDDAVPTKAIVADTLLVKKVIAVDNRRKQEYVELVPIIHYEFEGRTYSDTMHYWGASVTDNVTSSNKVYELGDSIEIMVNAMDPTIFLRKGEEDDTNWVGFLIWGGIGAMLLLVTYRRITAAPKS